MPYNLELEKRLDKLIAQPGTFTKKKMFGGVGYLIRGNLVFGIHRQSLVIRTSPERAEELLKRDWVSIFDITGRPMKGWLMVSPDGLKTEKQLSDLLNIAIDYVRSLPRK